MATVLEMGPRSSNKLPLAKSLVRDLQRETLWPLLPLATYMSHVLSNLKGKAKSHILISQDESWGLREGKGNLPKDVQKSEFLGC